MLINRYLGERVDSHRIPVLTYTHTHTQIEFVSSSRCFRNVVAWREGLKLEHIVVVEWFLIGGCWLAPRVYAWVCGPVVCEMAYFYSYSFHICICGRY